MRVKEKRIFVGDFETTVFSGQTRTDVWASAFVELFDDNVTVVGCIEDSLKFLIDLNSEVVCYYHNLKFDGMFWLSYLKNNPDFTEASYIDVDEEIGEIVKFYDTKNMPDNSYSYLISSMGTWYFLKIKVNGKIIELRDSLKLLPFSVKEIGKSFETKHKKTDIEYTGYRYPNCPISDEELEYIKNDVLVVKEALEIMYNEGHKKMTIGSCCLNEFKKPYHLKEWKSLYPDLTTFPLDPEIYGSKTIFDYVEKSYRGGWCYLVEGKENKVFKNGITLDVNSLYPSVMHSESNNRYPIGKPNVYEGRHIPNYIRDGELNERYYYFIRFKCKFKLKDGFLPTLQIKHNMYYKPREMLKSIDFYLAKEKKYVPYIIGENGVKIEAKPTLTMTQTDYILFKKHYNLYDVEFLDAMEFGSTIGEFDNYINHYKEIKLNSKGAKRTLAKLFLNNLYGKMATKPASDYKIAYLNEDGSIGFFNQIANDKVAGYMPIGAAITSYARAFTITAAQKNFYGADKAGFIYADTDSIHCDLPIEKINGVVLHDKDFLCWKLENEWDEGIFVRPKTYLEKTGNNYDIKCAGMPERCKMLFIESIEHPFPIKLDELDDKRKKLYSSLTLKEKSFIAKKRSITDFKSGLSIYGKLIPKNIAGGTLLVTTEYTIK